MAQGFFDRAYATTAQDAIEDLYDDWAESYDADLTGNGYLTPGRCAAALAGQIDRRDAPILDFACGTGLSGAALAAEGFTVIDGIDLSAAMLRTARARGHYRHLVKADPDQPPDVTPGDYAAIAAVGAVSPGAAPAHYLDALLACLTPGGLLVLSYNDHTLDSPDYTARLERALDRGIVRERVREQGDHILALGSKSTVYVLEKCATPG